MAGSGQVTELAFERAPDSEACHSFPGTETFPVYQAPSQL